MIKNKLMKTLSTFSKEEWLLWLSSVILITSSSIVFNQGNSLVLIASLIGTTSLIFNAKGNPIGQFLMVVFSLLYGYISYTTQYYGEMATYLGMTAPMAVIALISWLKNPYEGNQSEVQVNQVSTRELRGMLWLSALVTLVFYFILDAFHTNQMALSTMSVATSFIAVYLTFRRSPLFALAYAANDLVLILLWTIAALNNTSYWSVVICFILFLVNDVYGYVSWSNRQKRQAAFKNLSHR